MLAASEYLFELRVDKLFGIKTNILGHTTTLFYSLRCIKAINMI